MGAVQARDPGSPIDYGSFAKGRAPRTTPAGSRNEAFSYAWRIAERVGWDRQWIEGVSLASAAFQLAQQFSSPAQRASVPNYARAEGGFRTGVRDDTIRI